MDKPEYTIGCYIDGSGNNPDEFSQDILDFTENLGYEYDHPIPEGEDKSQSLYEESEDAVDWLNEHTLDSRPAFTYWTVDDGSLLLTANVDEARDEALVIGPKDTRPEYLLEISDHGNATLYNISREEVWSVV